MTRNNYIYKVGVELEGIYYSMPPSSNLYEVSDDGSIRILDINRRRTAHSCLDTAEVITLACVDYDNLISIIRMCYPDDTNETCGGHIHVSLTQDKYYLALTDARFISKLLARADAFANSLLLSNDPDNKYDGELLLHRLSGRHPYIDRDIEIDDQMSVSEKAGCRYALINYCKKYHGTIEFRFVPVFRNIDNYIKMLEIIIETIDEHLNKHIKSINKLIKEGVCVL